MLTHAGEVRCFIETGNLERAAICRQHFAQQSRSWPALIRQHDARSDIPYTMPAMLWHVSALQTLLSYGLATVLTQLFQMNVSVSKATHVLLCLCADQHRWRHIRLTLKFFSVSTPLPPS